MIKQCFLNRALVLLGTFVTTTSHAQTKNVSGIVTNSSDGPLSQATVRVKDGKASTTTNVNGYFKFDVPEATQLLITRYGFLPQPAKADLPALMSIQKLMFRLMCGRILNCLLAN